MKLEGINIEQRIKNTLMETLEMKFIQTDDPNSIEALMPVSPKVSQTMGVLHGGATISLAETVAGVGSNLICAIDERCLGMQISANHISSARLGDVVRAKATVVHKGKATHVWNVDVFSESTGKLISSVRVTNAVVSKVHMDN